MSTEIVMRMVGEWKAVKDLGRTIRYALKVTAKDCMRIWRDWLEERPYFKCPECNGWAPKIALRYDGRCVWCEVANDEPSSDRSKTPYEN